MRASAKINSYLEVLARREDGYHEIRTVFHEIDLCDTIRFTLTENKRIKFFTNVKSLQNRENLVCRISRFIQKTFSVQAGAAIDLHKSIPVAAGLGGGSSDAATTIRALSELWSLHLSDEQMHDIAAEFGSDINFFLVGGRAAGFGRGERIEPLADSGIENIVLANPGFGVSSAEAYSAVERYDGSDAWDKYLASGDVRLAHNALQAGVCRRFPAIQALLNDIAEAGARPLLSGSGPTVIGFCPDAETATALCGRFARRGMWSIVTRARGRGETSEVM
ncbi:MAG: 4-(cytidine 5'-diphospho)-2-C-methyl-D-erythritol kinase [Candidatus Cloacimonetes bacterium]|nr:4-(cytidine 5'-diphospho)-2-C-methyl-D-erythritol kinase [Candidatus Cloacimonadota bacterium]